jgi:hypothetical protein
MRCLTLANELRQKARVSFICRELFLKTIYPSRKMTNDYPIFAKKLIRQVQKNNIPIRGQP